MNKEIEAKFKDVFKNQQLIYQRLRYILENQKTILEVVTGNAPRRISFNVVLDK